VSRIIEKLKALFGFGAEVGKGDDQHHSVKIEHHYNVECWRLYDPDDPESGRYLAWAVDFDNLVVTAGLNKYLDATLKTGLASPSWFVFLVTGPGSGNTYAAADTMGSHAGWAENTSYAAATRPAFTPGTVASGSVDNSAAKASFSINASVTLAGSGMADNSTKGGSTGTLLGVGNFTGGDRTAVNTDVINVTITASIA
jgi:hypothetical protein